MHEARITALVEPILAQHGLELDELTITPAGKRKVLRVTVDGDGDQGKGLLLDDISAASRQLSITLDSSDAVGKTPYTLEVSSRGVSKPLTEPKHYRRNAGRFVTLQLADAEVTGRITSVTDAEVGVEVEGAERSYPLSEIRKAIVQVEMSKKTKAEES